jgi:hypothetical protein
MTDHPTPPEGERAWPIQERRTIKLLRDWAERELAGTGVNREAHLGYMAAQQMEALLARVAPPAPAWTGDMMGYLKQQMGAPHTSPAPPVDGALDVVVSELKRLASDAGPFARDAQQAYAHAASLVAGLRRFRDAVLAVDHVAPAAVGEPLRDRIEAILCRYRCQHNRTEDGDPLSLVDVLSPFDTVVEGQEEIHLIADDLAAELLGAAPSAEREGLATELEREAHQWCESGYVSPAGLRQAIVDYDVPIGKYRVELLRRAAAALRARPGEGAIAAEREIMTDVTCGACGRKNAIGTLALRRAALAKDARKEEG